MNTDISTAADTPLDGALRTLLDGDRVSADLRAGPLTYLDATTADQVLAEADAQRRSLLAAVDDVPDLDELAYLIACRYVEFKAGWIQANTRIQYRSMMGAGPDRTLEASAACVAHLLLLIEPLIDEAHLDRINGLLFTPLA